MFGSLRGNVNGVGTSRGGVAHRDTGKNPSGLEAK